MNLNSCFYDFSTDFVNVIVLLYDKSGSMAGYSDVMMKANNAFKKDFLNFRDKDSIAICKAQFSEGIKMGDFLPVEAFSVDYDPNGGTELYNAITEAVDNTINYYNEVIKRLNIIPRITFLCFSDGEDNNDYKTEIAAAKEAIKKLNKLEATTVFVAFNDAIKHKIGEKLGFNCTKDITSTKELINCMGIELSKSCKEQSKSAYSLKSEFFSKVGNNSDEGKIESDSIDDDDFFDV